MFFQRWSIRMKYLGVAVLGVGVLGVAVLGTGVLGVAVLGTAVLRPQTTILPTQHSFTRLFPQSISNHGAALNMKMVKGL